MPANSYRHGPIFLLDFAGIGIVCFLLSYAQHGRTPLHVAVTYEDAATVGLLIVAGADISILDSVGYYRIEAIVYDTQMFKIVRGL